MISLNLVLDREPAFPDLADHMDRVIHLGNDDPPIGVAALAGGMTSGRTSVVLRIDLPDGSTVLAETSLRLFLMAADALRVRFGDE